MDLGISGRRALVCASSKGLGRGCAEALAAEGVDLVLNARGTEALEATADAIRAAHGVDVIAVAADITTEAGQAEVLAAAGSIDILVTNAGGPPPGMWSDWSRDDFISAFDANLLTPIALIKALLPGMMERGWGRIVNITSVAVKAPIPVLGLVEHSALRPYWLCGRCLATGGGQWRHDQQFIARSSRYRSFAHPRQGRRCGAGHYRAGCSRGQNRNGACRAVRHCRRIWRRLCLVVLRQSGLCHWPEHSARWGCVPGRDVKPIGAIACSGLPQSGACDLSRWMRLEVSQRRPPKS